MYPSRQDETLAPKSVESYPSPRQMRGNLEHVEVVDFQMSGELRHASQRYFSGSLLVIRW